MGTHVYDHDERILQRKATHTCASKKNFSTEEHTNKLPPKKGDTNIKDDSVNELFLNENYILNSWTKVVGIETLYTLLCNKHLALQRAYHELQNRIFKEEDEMRKRVDEKLKSVKICGESCQKEKIAQIQQLQNRELELVTEIQELREQNELLEFRLLELEDYSGQTNVAKQEKNNHDNLSERDDISDSGIISLSPCEEFYTEYDTQSEDEKYIIKEVEIVEKLSRICRQYPTDNAMDKIIIQGAIDLIKHHEIRITSLETTLTHMCQERVENDREEFLEAIKFPEEAKNKYHCYPSKVVATVPPFTDRQTKCYTPDTDTDSSSIKKMFQDVDCLQESGIFDEFAEFDCPELKSQETQTDGVIDNLEARNNTELKEQLHKLNKIKEKLEEQGNHTALFKSLAADPTDALQNDLKHYIFYKEQYEILNDKLAVYEASGEAETKSLTYRLQREIELTTLVKQLKDTLQRVEKEKLKIEEEKCEYEESENDTRLRCQKLEVKLYALVEKKNDLQFRLQQNSRTLSNLRSTIAELEKKRSEAYQHSHKMEMLANEYEERNFQLEESEMEVRDHLQLLESSIPAIILWNILSFIRVSFKSPHLKPIEHSLSSDISKPSYEELLSIIQILENKLKDQSVLLKKFAEEQKCKMSQESEIYCTMDEHYTENRDFQIKEFEIKERVYEQTLQQADELITHMENEYKQKLEQLDLLLSEKNYRLEECERKIKNIYFEKDRENQLVDKIQSMEFELANLKQLLRAKEEEKQRWLLKDKHQIEELDSLNMEFAHHKEIEQELRNKLEVERNLVKHYKKEIEFKQKEMKELENGGDIKVKQLQNRILRQKRDIENLEVTNSELKEEVDTLENVIEDLRQSLNREKDKKEKMQIELSQELSNKQQEIDNLSRLSQDVLASNTAEELNNVGINEQFHQELFPTDLQIIADNEIIFSRV